MVLKILFLRMLFMYKVILICSYAYSGSTLLDILLGSYEGIFSVGELHAFLRPHRKHHFSINCSCQNSKCPFWSKLRNINEKNIYYEIFKKSNSKCIVDSSKHLCWIFDINFRYYKDSKIDVYNVLLWKHPFNYAYSVWKRKQNIYNELQGWALYYKRFFELKLPFFILSYESFIKKPDYFLNEIISYTGLTTLVRDSTRDKYHLLFGNNKTISQLINNGLYIKNSINYHDDFIKISEEISKYIYENPAVSLTLSSLEEATSVSSKNLNIFRPPLWYYKEKFKLKIKKYFPENFKHE